MKGLLMIPEMAIAACRDVDPKTNTRRVIGPQPVSVKVSGLGPMWRLDYPDSTTSYFFDHTITPDVVAQFCDYKVGERRCLLTTWAVPAHWDSRKPTELPIFKPHAFWHAGLTPKKPMASEVRWGKSRPGRFLPNTLRHLMPVFEITSVRAERVQDITVDGAKAEGIEPREHRDGLYWRNYLYTGKTPGDFTTAFGDPRKSFASLWDSINAKRGHGWNTDPWVWAVTFKKVS